MTDELAEVKRRLCEAMRYDADDWLERATYLLDGAWRAQQRGKIYDVTTVGGRIRAAREAIGMSQEQLALRLDVRQQVVSAWEQGKRDIELGPMRRLCIILKPAASRAWLLMESDEGGPKVAQDKLGKDHSARWWKWKKQQEAWKKAQDEVERREAARKERARKTAE